MKATSKLFAILALPALATAVSVVTIATNLKDNADATVLGEGPDHNHEGMTAWESDNSLPNSAGRYYLTQDVTISSTWNVSSVIDLCLNGHSITKTGSTNAVISTNGSDAELNLYDCGETTHYYYIDPTSYLGVVVDTLEEAVSGNPERNGTFKGGYITGGRGSFLDGDYRAGCVFVNNHSSFNLYGGTLIGNMANTSSKGGSYGTIWCRFGDFSMHGGAIIGNYSKSVSAIAVNGENDRFENIIIDGGIIADNTSNNGGAISIGGNADWSITGGTIRRNYTLDKNAPGGALYVCNRASNAGGKTSMAHIGGDVEITENRTAGVGGGIYLASADWQGVCGSISISGSPKIYGNYASHGENEYVADNIYLPQNNNPLYATGNAFFLDGTLEEGANIGFSMDAGGVFLQDWKATMGDADPLDYFHSDSAEMLLQVNDNGDPMLFDLGAVQAMVINGDEVSYFETLSAALAAWGDGTTLKLNKDVEGQIAVTTGEKTLDVNNHVLNCTTSPTISVDNAKLHIVDSCAEKTIRYYTPNEEGVATLSATPTEHFFEGGYFTGVSGGSGLALANGAEVTLSGGTFFGKEGGSSVGANVPEGTTLTIEGTGGIIGNYQNAGKYPYTSGAGMVLAGTLIMRGGKVCDNTASTGCGGIRITNANSVFTMTGGEISGNLGHSWLAGGIHVDPAAAQINLGGSAKIYNNRYQTSQKNLGLPTNCKVNIVEPFTKEANIHIFPGLEKEDKDQGQATAENPIILTSNWSEVMGATDPYGYFTCDPVYNRNLSALLASYEVYGQDGQVALAPVSYVVSFDSNSGTGSMPEDSSTQRVYTLPENSFTAPEGMKFIGWKWNANGKVYLPGEKVFLSSDTTFTAQWGKAPTPEWNGLSGIVYASDGLTPIAGAKVKLVQGNETYDIAFTDANGQYHFSCPDGFYNLVVEYGDSSKTVLVESSEGAVKNIVLSEGKTDSILDVDGDLGVAVGGLDLEAEAIRKAEGIPEDKDVCLTMNVAQKPAETAQNADEIMEEAPEKDFEFYEIKVEKKVDDVTSELDQTNNVIEVVIPYANVTKREVSVSSYHDGKVVNYVESDTKEAGTFILDKENGLVKIYANQFSTFGISYTPYFNIGATITLGSYTGVVTATLTNVATNEVVAKLENVALDQVAFQDLKRGQYLLTITWVDGAPNTITMPIKIG